ncbi:hypothetical protein F5882DRAFT_479498 [Hyaloscypha sp. PMI_1271]|nr:hypothetical protein F5882DRAFT_479498 [Hyaloscypha sp. PMI_1271]
MSNTDYESQTVTPAPENPSRSLFGSIRKGLNRKSSNVSTRSNTSATGQEPQAPLTNPSHPGMNEPPPAYTPSPNTALGPTRGALPSELAVPSSLSYSPATPAVSIPATIHPSGEDPYAFLTTFDTILLIDDSGSMAGPVIAPIVSSHDDDGLDLYFMNHKSADGGSPNEGIAAGGYRGIKRAATVTEIFARVRPQGGTPTGTRVHNILKPYLAKLEAEMATSKEMKPLNLIMLTDSIPSDDVEAFFQVGNEEGAKEVLEELDDGLSELIEGGVRDISEGGVGLTGNRILKVVLSAIVKRLDHRWASGEVRRTARS